MSTDLLVADPAQTRTGSVWDYISPSRLNCWITCPLKFRAKYIDGIRTPTTPSLFLGKRVHAGLEHFYRHKMLGIMLESGDVLARMDDTWEQAAAEEEMDFKAVAEETALRKQAADLVDVYLAQIAADEPRPLGVEVTMETPLVDPDRRVVIPFAPEAIVQQDGHRPGVVVRDGRFVLPSNNTTFRPVGFNYIRLFNRTRTAVHDNFSRTGYNASEHEAMLRRLAENGFNTVRVFINHQAGEVVDSRDSEELSAVYLDNVTDFLRRARRHGVYVVLSIQRQPAISHYRDLHGQPDPMVTGANRFVLHPGWIRAKAAYLQDVLTGIVHRDPDALASVFAIDLQNEMCFYPAEKPFRLQEGVFTAPNGRTYDLATQKQQLADDCAIHTINAWSDAVHRVFPGVLIDVNVFTFEAVGRTGPGDFHRDSEGWRNRVPFRPLAIVRSKADLVDVHLYSRSLDRYQRDLRSIEFDQLERQAASAGKPMIVGEFGLFKRQFDGKLDAACHFLKTQWLPQLDRDWSGWLYWTYDTHEQPALWNATDSGYTVFNILSQRQAQRIRSRR